MMIQDTWQFQTTFRNYYLKYCKPNYTVSRDCFSFCRFIKHVCGCLTIESTQTIVYISIALIVLYPRRILLRKHSSSGINSQFVLKFMPEICETAPDFTRFWIASINWILLTCLKPWPVTNPLLVELITITFMALNVSQTFCIFTVLFNFTLCCPHKNIWKS